MRERVLSSAVVVAAGLIPTICGGPIFALFMFVIGALGYSEYLRLASQASGRDYNGGLISGLVVIAAMSIAGLLGASSTVLFTIAAVAVSAPLVATLANVSTPGMFGSWALASTGSLYLGLPVYAAVALRSTSGQDVSELVSQLAGYLSLGWSTAPLGLAWAMTVILATWIGDSIAYLVGRSMGSILLAPVISPSKTLEGAFGGLVGSSVAGGFAFLWSGIGPWWMGVLAGCLIGVAGQTGDLSESFLKRQAGVKDSGSLIPGHGGILDRIDALLFAFPVALVLAAAFETLELR